MGTQNELSKRHKNVGRQAATTVHVRLSFLYSLLVGLDVHQFEFYFVIVLLGLPIVTLVIYLRPKHFISPSEGFLRNEIRHFRQ